MKDRIARIVYFLCILLAMTAGNLRASANEQVLKKVFDETFGASHTAIKNELDRLQLFAEPYQVLDDIAKYGGSDGAKSYEYCPGCDSISRTLQGTDGTFQKAVTVNEVGDTEKRSVSSSYSGQEKAGEAVIRLQRSNKYRTDVMGESKHSSGSSQSFKFHLKTFGLPNRLELVTYQQGKGSGGKAERMRTAQAIHVKNRTYWLRK